jgi:hypothetical protein
MKAVFTTKQISTYDDDPSVRYHFPRTYLRQVQQAVGDLVLYYEPRRISLEESSRGGRQSYFAVAQVPSEDDFGKWRQLSERELKTRYSIDFDDAGLTETDLRSLFESFKVPAEFVEWFAIKYDLTAIKEYEW